MKTRYLFPATAFAFAATFWGCHKDESVSSGDVTSQAADFEQVEQIGSDADDMADEAFANGSANLRLSSGNAIQGCATVTNDTVNHVLTIDFGTGCTGNDGRFRSGQIIVTYNGHYFDPGYSRTISFNNYFVDSSQVTGTRTIVNNGPNGAGHLTWTITAQNLRVTLPSGYYHEWNSTRTREMIAGENTPHWIFDDVYLITGSGTATNSNGGSHTISILNPLRKELSCHWIVSGTVEITPLNHPIRTLDYGNGNCDRHATVTVNGVTRNILLH